MNEVQQKKLQIADLVKTEKQEVNEHVNQMKQQEQLKNVQIK